MREMPTGVSHGPETTAHRAVTGSNSRCLAEPSHALPRLDIDKHPAGASAAKSLSRGERGEDPVRRGNDQPVERGVMFQGNELDTAFALRLRRVGERIGNQSGGMPNSRNSATISATRYYRAPFLRFGISALSSVTRSAGCCQRRRDKRERSTEDIRMTHAPAPEIE